MYCVFPEAEGDAEGLLGSDDAEDGGGSGRSDGLSKHQRRTAAMQAHIAAMEAAAVGDKDWFLRGEAQAGAHLLRFSSPLLRLSTHTA